MVVGLAFLATAISTVFAETVLVRWSRRRRPHEGAWTVALAMFALASAALATGASTGWDRGTFRAFYLLGAVLNVPWLALGTVHLLAPQRVARRARTVVLLFTGLAAGVVLAAPMPGAVVRSGIPEGRRVFGAFPRALAGIGSGLGALVVFGGAVWSAWRYVRERRQPRYAGANALIAAGTLILSAGGLLEGVAGGKDEAFTLSLVLGIAVIYAGFAVATRDRDPRATSAPPT